MADLETRQAQGGHWAPRTDDAHSNVPGAALEATKHAVGRDEDPNFSPDRTVNANHTQEPVSVQRHGVGNGPQVRSTTNELEVVCGPLLNYRHMSGEHTDNPVWHGSVLVVTTPGQVPEKLRLSYGGPVDASTSNANGQSESQDRTFAGVKLYEDPHKAFWQYSVYVPFQENEAYWEYSIPRMRAASDGKPVTKPMRFAVPSKHESMRIMFHSCNGFSVGTDEDAWSGPALWQDVLRVHAQQPFHVMIGGGDQIYNDSVRVGDGPLAPWAAMANPHKRREFPFNEELRAKCDIFYFNNYVRWYGCEPFSSANGQIPQLNIWDDHDIIDGFGSYTDHFMRSPVFRGIGGVAHKYYMLFQHHIPPPVSTYTTDAPQTTKPATHGTPPDAVQLKDSYVMKPYPADPSYIIGTKPGPYVEERSRSIYCQLGKRIAFLGIDARTERTRHQINYPETYNLLFHTASERIAASKGEIKHLVLLLGVPIAYPRLQWLENILQSPIIGPIRFLNKRFGLAGGFFNHFDGNVDLLDDLDDHYTAHQHKHERKDLVLRLQELAAKHSIRVTILGGDVHLAAMGRFYSKPSLNIPAERDFRYMANIVSSAITNKPPPAAVSNLLARRNKVHHFDHQTDETLLNLFDKNPGAGEPGVKPKTAGKNRCTMPSRNYAIICESHSHTGPAQTNGHANGSAVNGTTNGHANGTTNGHIASDEEAFTAPKNPREPLHLGEKHAGTTHAAAGGIKKTGLAGIDGLDVTIRVEKDPSYRDGRTEGYGFSIPALQAGSYHLGKDEKW